MNKIKRNNIEAFLKFCGEKEDTYLLSEDYSEAECGCAYYRGADDQELIDKFFKSLEEL